MDDDDAPRPDASALIDRFGGRFPVHAMRRRRTPDGSYRYDYVSPTVAETFGLDPGRLCGQDAVGHEWLHPEDRGRFLDALERSAATLATLDEEIRVIRPDGVVKWVRSLGQPVRLTDGTVVWDGVALDVTDRRDALAQVERAMQSARAAELSASRLSHGASVELAQALMRMRRALWLPGGGADIAEARAALSRLEWLLDFDGASDASGPAARPARLTGRQTEIARRVALGLTNREIAAELGLTEGTVKLHVSRILRRLGLRNRAQLSAHVQGSG